MPQLVPTQESRLLWTCTAASKKLAYYISYEDGSYSRRANVSVPQSAIDSQTPGPELAFSKGVEWHRRCELQWVSLRGRLV